MCVSEFKKSSIILRMSWAWMRYHKESDFSFANDDSSLFIDLLGFRENQTLFFENRTEEKFWKIFSLTVYHSLILEKIGFTQILKIENWDGVIYVHQNICDWVHATQRVQNIFGHPIRSTLSHVVKIAYFFYRTTNTYA